MIDFDSIWRTQDEIRTVVNAVLGALDLGLFKLKIEASFTPCTSIFRVYTSPFASAAGPSVKLYESATLTGLSPSATILFDCP